MICPFFFSFLFLEWRDDSQAESICLRAAWHHSAFLFRRYNLFFVFLFFLLPTQISHIAHRRVEPFLFWEQHITLVDVCGWSHVRSMCADRPVGGVLGGVVSVKSLMMPWWRFKLQTGQPIVRTSCRVRTNLFSLPAMYIGFKGQVIHTCRNTHTLTSLRFPWEGELKADLPNGWRDDGSSSL